MDYNEIEWNRGWQEGERGGHGEEEIAGAEAPPLCCLRTVMVRQVGIQIWPWKLRDHPPDVYESYRGDPRDAIEGDDPTL
mgnify:CR=1 FL=1